MLKILVATDGSEHAKKVIKTAIRIAKPTNSRVIVLCVEDWTHVERDSGLKTREAVEQAVEVFKKYNVPVSPLTRKGTKRPADVIIEVAKEQNVDFIILGSRGLRGIKEVFLGSVSQRVVQLADRNVVVVK